MIGGPKETLLPLSGAKSKCLGILRNSTLCLVRSAAGERGLNLNADFDFGVWVGGEGRNDFVGDVA